MTKPIVWALNSSITIQPGSFREAFSRAFGSLTFPVDRFGICNDTISTVNIVPDPVYNLLTITTDWQDRYYSICDQAADNVYRTAGDRSITVFYSGGVDSVTATVALMRHKNYQEFLSQGRFKIALTSLSIQEYPEFFYQHILPTVPIVPADYNTLIADQSTVCVTGDGGDFVIGNTDTPVFTFEELDRYLPVLDPTNSFKSLLEDISKQAPFEISSVTQLYWWLGQCFFNQKDICYPYVWSSCNDLSGMSKFDQVYRFFFDPAFITYSFEYMSTNPIYTSVRDLRLFPKQYIVDYTKHTSYLNKTKAMSQRSTIRKFYKSTIYSDLTFDSIP